MDELDHAEKSQPPISYGLTKYSLEDNHDLSQWNASIFV